MDHLDAANAQEKGKRPARHVVGGWALGVPLNLQQVLDMGTVGLVATYDEGPGGVGPAVRRQWLGGLVDLDTASQQHIDQSPGGGGVAVIAGDQPGPRRRLLSPLDHPRGDLEAVSEPILRLACEARQQRTAEGKLVIDDVAKPPPPARPGVGESVGGGVAAKAAGTGELVSGQEDRRGDPDRGALREQADDVVPHGDIAIAAVPPHVVGDTGGDAGEPLAGHVEQRPAPKSVDR